MYLYKNQTNVSKYTSPMDPMGFEKIWFETGGLTRNICNMDLIFDDDGSLGEQKTQISQRLCN